ncbi:GntR family transcriptional regulator [Novosphingobium resinovorum]|uniref:GntR family transcriptional regulator n=1 Tax=Novosphingobium resinovorum TaxID=158500 RepID=UPI002ED583C0|nr:GntR family transcriptional regulator [Novosphingobium resinovorum]
MTAVKRVPSIARSGGLGQLARDAAIPLYHQIYLTLRDEITRGDRPFGSPVPTEMELADNYDVSRITARRALDELATGGFVERRRRLGTHVIFRAASKPIEANIDQAVESLIAFGQNTAVKVLEVVTEPASEATAQKLGLVEGEPAIRAVRLRSTSNGPLGLIVSHMRAGLGVSVTPERLTERPILSLLRDAGVKIGGAVQTIEAMVADPEMAERLQCEPRAAVLHVERMVEDAAGVTVLVTNAYYRADRYRITLDMHEQGQFSPKFG